MLTTSFTEGSPVLNPFFVTFFGGLVGGMESILLLASFASATKLGFYEPWRSGVPPPPGTTNLGLFGSYRTDGAGRPVFKRLVLPPCYQGSFAARFHRRNTRCSLQPSFRRLTLNTPSSPLR